MSLIHITTMNGAVATDESEMFPISPREAVIAMGRMCRYAGHLACSTLTHSLLVAGLGAEYATIPGDKKPRPTEEWVTSVFVAGLVHDVHEIFTGDFVGTKPDWLRKMQDAIDLQLWRQVGLRGQMMSTDKIVRDTLLAKFVHRVDLMARFCEARQYAGITAFSVFTNVPGFCIPVMGPMGSHAEKFLDSGWGRLHNMSAEESQITFRRFLGRCLEVFRAVFTGSLEIQIGVMHDWMGKVWFAKDAQARRDFLAQLKA